MNREQHSPAGGLGQFHTTRWSVVLLSAQSQAPGSQAALAELSAAARLRHSNVATVLHLGRTGSSYFYAMEFVEGESVEHLIKRSGRLEAKVALEIASQVAAGLAAVHKQKLVHRDIKPSNIMVSLKEGGAVTARSSTSGWRSLHPTRRLKDWQSSSRIVERSWRWTAWSRSKIREVHKRDGLREASLQALLRELTAFNTGLCVITTRMPVDDIADHERASALRRELEQLSSDAGAKLLRALGVKGHEAELRSASDEFRGHCLALT